MTIGSESWPSISWALFTAAAAAAAASGGGHIVNVSSVAAYLGKGSSIPLHGIESRLEQLDDRARTLAPEIRVNAVAPGFITGRWLEQGYGDSYEAVLRAAAKKTRCAKSVSPTTSPPPSSACSPAPTSSPGRFWYATEGCCLGSEALPLQEVPRCRGGARRLRSLCLLRG